MWVVVQPAISQPVNVCSRCPIFRGVTCKIQGVHSLSPSSDAKSISMRLESKKRPGCQAPSATVGDRAPGTGKWSGSGSPGPMGSNLSEQRAKDQETCIDCMMPVFWAPGGDLALSMCRQAAVADFQEPCWLSTWFPGKTGRRIPLPSFLKPAGCKHHLWFSEIHTSALATALLHAARACYLRTRLGIKPPDLPGMTCIAKH